MNDGNNVFKIAVSVGATAVMPDENIHAAIERADAALYRAKEAGRNRVELDNVTG
ncbi:MAG: diguanylate cyclase [Pseudomonadota bacterium]